jgi:hypothetical protein
MQYATETTLLSKQICVINYRLMCFTFEIDENNIHVLRRYCIKKWIGAITMKTKS